MTALVVASRLHSWRPHDCTLNDAIAIEFVQWRILIVKRTIDETKKASYMAEAKVLRAYFYYKLNIVYKGVPIYLEPVEASECYEGQSSEAEVWKTVINDLTEAIAEPALPEKYGEGAAEYGRATKGLAYTLRWPYRGFDTAAPFDLKTDTNNRFYYLFRKFVAEGASEIPNRTYSPIDVPLIRYADVLLNLAECYNELGEQEKAIACVNQVRGRAGAALLNSNTFTQVTGQDDLRRRIRNERRWEFNGEGINFFDEMRWGTWKESKFFAGSGLKQMWGEPQYVYAWSGDQVYTWPAPWSERQLNEDLTLADGWKD